MPLRWPAVSTLRSALGAVAAVVLLCGGGQHPAAAAAIPPRVEAHSEEFDIVGIAEKGLLTIYVDRYATSHPVEAATVTVKIDKETLTATERGNGIYTVASKAIRNAGRYGVAFTVSAGDVDDLLGGTLIIKDSSEDAVSGAGGTGVGLGAGLLLAGVAVGFAAERWRTRRRRPAVPAGAAADAGATAGEAATADARAAATAALLLVALALAGGGSALAAPAGPGHSHGEGGVSVDVGSAALPPDSPRRLPDGSLFVPMPSQRLLSTRTAITEVKEQARAVRVVGRVVPDPGASGKIQSSMNGRVDFADGGLPMVGQRVARGQVLAAVVPVVNPFDRGNIQVHLSQLNDEIGDLTRRLAEASQPGSGLSQRELDHLRGELDLLKRRRSSISLVVGDRESVRAALRSPVDGVIAASNAVAGQVVEARDVLFEVVDPQRLWVEAAAFNFDLVDNIASATAVTGTGQTLQLAYLSRGPRLRQQAIQLNFRIEAPDSRLIVGSPVRVLIQTKRKQTGILLPSAAVVRNAAGQSMVWERQGSERFVPMMVLTEPVDGETVLIVNGLTPGRRIVVEGADLLNQVR